ncbi:MAG: SMP-30/gluconolactonase/LRE family protein [Rhodospirillales bacterium]|nr:SMP-30/gluconolactonase/LRE family protein [Rhodospirillales bacterium]
MAEPSVLGDVRAELGESPVWSAGENAVYWIDIRGKLIHRTDPGSGGTRSWGLPSHPGMILLRRKGGLVVALEDGIHAFDPATGNLDLLVPLEAEIPENRPNDGKCDAAGRLWVGTMNKHDSDLATGGFYRIDPDLSATLIESGLKIPNGLAWSPDGARMFRTDTRSGLVRASGFDAATGGIWGETEFFAFDRALDGGVDGAAMDTDGGYWTAQYGVGRLRRTLPDGSAGMEIPLPVSQPTMPAFGGPGMKTLFVTSARQRLGAEALSAQPAAGALLAVETEFTGAPVGEFGG